ncbi:MAG: thrombospondin type 3 repeat-containing protein [Candidatus Electronema sp. V4]|uniref:thrombospondin type 3 repeat-containing protein n=1 Tax=Candidatus Electronema sp. V4 TaxID=3454756 RepID=UPI004055519D
MQPGAGDRAFIYMFFYIILFFSLLFSPTVVSAVDCPPAGTGNTATETNYYGYSDSAAALAACQLVRSQKLALGGNCSGCTADSGDYYFLHYHVSLYLPASYHQYRFVYCNDLTDTDGDGIPDSQDPCPDNPSPDCTPPDSDGDGIPDDEDPCPQNPNPDCTDPDNPPPDLPPNPEFPDEIIIGDCVVDISDITSLFKAEGGVFPINWIVAFGSALRAFTQVEASEAPSFKYSFSFFGHPYEIDLHLERFDSIASFVRLISGLLAIFYFIRFANRGFFKVITGSGT